jgi:hypothetical protein
VVIAAPSPFPFQSHGAAAAAEAFDALTRTLARICGDPYDRLFSRPIRGGDPSERMAEFGDSGFIEFTVDQAEGLVHVYTLLWFG